MPGTWTVTPGTVPIHTFTAPEDGWLVASHIIELPSLLLVVDALFHRLVDAENRHDLVAVRPFLWDSPSTLFVAKTSTTAEGNCAGFWGTDVVMQHFHDLYQSAFVMAPNYGRVKTVGLTADVAETYAPLDITVAYGGQTPVPKPFLMIVTWVRTPAGWKMAADVALPIPPVPPQSD
jgi:hypothetical protein